MPIPPISDAYINEIIKSAGPYVESINKTQGVKLRELIKTLRDYFEQEIVAANSAAIVKTFKVDAESTVSMGNCGMYSKVWMQYGESNKLNLPSNPVNGQVVDMWGIDMEGWSEMRIFYANGVTRLNIEESPVGGILTVYYHHSTSSWIIANTDAW